MVVVGVPTTVPDVIMMPPMLTATNGDPAIRTATAARLLAVYRAFNRGSEKETPATLWDVAGGLAGGIDRENPPKYWSE